MSIQTGGLNRISGIPLSQIRRPIAPVLDHQKIDAMVSTMKGTPEASKTCTKEEAAVMNSQLPPIDVLCVRDQGKTYYFGFGGCHRFQAYERIRDQTGEDVEVRCKIIPATRSQLKLYVGSSIDDMFN
ncbi:LANO_0F16798g1_1 [Lachancea nothofagi CBS 11611]|uniref:Sulfiredoxin n=1 Tax=Lachancea nothofagi CBS 11611 TaxID=1266666 RepID=A0A1G4KCX3_9SACH|nr:LANO_0F16798g1_1 [Lachancea nothofagi CBS 11611]